jgi:hypothetical protein
VTTSSPLAHLVRDIGIIGALDSHSQFQKFVIRRIPNPFIELGQNMFVTCPTECWCIVANRTNKTGIDDYSDGAKRE